ncbi:unnamed protein product [Bursaphelenchus okinawaensis]|uniref:Hexosyltransferase n=1 Tax=Bursaphelenchus okinawaensis TaxID=465554 RepID=A0A811LJ66_9BILA|nr:unnamed protein product [Bursaphelenchus okinawaensis]CAG9127107.1 unnamed protein product [Bursaphelenchus okinawaensis]
MAVFTLRSHLRPVTSKLLFLVISSSLLYGFYYYNNNKHYECPTVSKLSLLRHYPIFGYNPYPQIQSTPKHNIPLNVTYPILSTTLTKGLKIAWIIHSSPGNFRERQYIRSEYLDQKTEIVPFFVILRSNTTTVNEDVHAEFRRYNDIILVHNIEDDYHNITHKIRAWIPFLHKLRPKVVLKTDDDVMINWNGMSMMLNQMKDLRNTVLCRVYSEGQVVRNSASKWYLSKEEYSDTSLGTYCQGMVMMFTGDLVNTMVENMDKVQYLWMDDWYLSRALLNGSQTFYIDIGRHYLSTNTEHEVQSFLKSPREIYFAHFRTSYRYELTERKAIWNKIKQAMC